MKQRAIRIPELQDRELNFGQVMNVLTSSIKRPKKNSFTFIDLFAGMGGIRLGFEKACKELNIKSKCVFSSEIKEHAVQTYEANFKGEEIHGDITKINEKNLPDFDYLLAGFPCQAFSSAGKRKGFSDIRGTLFFDIVRILKAKKPEGFILENVEGLVVHNNGDTFETILKELDNLNYKVSWKVLNASDFGIPQNRKRVYIVGHLKRKIDLDNFDKKPCELSYIIDNDYIERPSKFVKLLLEHYSIKELAGKSIKDRRGGDDNIHSWDIDYKGKITQKQKDLMNILLKKRRMKKWAIEKGIEWMDGMPLTIDEISTFYNDKNLKQMLEDLVKKGYLKFEHPKNLFIENGSKVRKYDITKPKGYNIVAGKLSFPLSTILSPSGIAPTIVATEAGKIAIATKKCIRNLTVREGLRLFGYPDSYKMDNIDYAKAFDLLGNTVIPPVITEITKRILG